MKIGEVAQRLGVSVSTLRMYEQRGLISAGRSPGGTRHYSEGMLQRFQAIVGLTRAEVAIEDLARLARARPENTSGDAASRQVETVLDEIERELQSRVDALRTILAELQCIRERLPGCHGCQRPPTRSSCTGCTVADQLLAFPVMHVVWDQQEDPAQTPCIEENGICSRT
jgi:DNA-binding transcriptional MerR regulator